MRRSFVGCISERTSFYHWPHQISANIRCALPGAATPSNTEKSTCKTRSISPLSCLPSRQYSNITLTLQAIILS